VTSRDGHIAAALRPMFAHEAAAIAESLEAAARGGRRDEVRSLAHRLAGSAGTVREPALVDASRELELLAAASTAPDEEVAARASSLATAVRRVVGTAPDAAPPPLQPDGDAETRRALVVAIEDSAANAELLRRIVESIPGVELVTCESGREGARIALERDLSLVLLDLDLPDVPGEWVLEALRGADGRPLADVVVVSGGATPGQEERARALGAVGYLAKPFEVARLRALVRDVCLGDQAT